MSRCFDCKVNGGWPRPLLTYYQVNKILLLLLRRESAYAHSNPVLLFLCMRKPCVLASLWALNIQRRPSAHNRCPCWSKYSLCAHGFLMVLNRCGSVYLKCTQLSLTFEYFELNNIPFGQLVYWSVVTLSHFPKDHISRKICIKLENS